jgi:hypothetical protein
MVPMIQRQSGFLAFVRQESGKYSVLLFLAKFLESGIGAQWVTDR